MPVSRKLTRNGFVKVYFIAAYTLGVPTLKLVHFALGVGRRSHRLAKLGNYAVCLRRARIVCVELNYRLYLNPTRIERQVTR